MDRSAGVGSGAVVAPPLTRSPPPADEPFRVARVYDLMRQTTTLVTTMQRAACTLVDLVSFDAQSPLVSVACLALVLLLAMVPTLILPLVQLAALRYMIWNYVYKVRCGGKPHTLDDEWRAMTDRTSTTRAAPDTDTASSTGAGDTKRSSGALASALHLINPLNLVAPIFTRKKNNRDDSHLHESAELSQLSRLLRPHLQAALRIIGVSRPDDGTLTTGQQVWSSALACFESVYDAVNWNSPESYPLARALVAALIGGIAYCCVAPQEYLCIVVGLFVFTRETVLGQNLPFIASSVVDAVKSSLPLSKARNVATEAKD